MGTENQLKKEILEKVREYYLLHHAKKEFIPGQTKVSYAGRVFDENEMIAATDSLLDFFLTFGTEGEKFERALAEKLGAKFALATNSGSSANLLAMSALCSDTFPNKIHPGEEVITPAVTFPTTANAIVRNNLKPVFVDCDIGTYNANLDEIRKAIGPKTRAVFLPHTLGNVSDMDQIMDICQKNNLYLIEDTCDALGSTFKGKMAGTFGIMGTFSFYPAHHMTMGEGGAVCTDDPIVKKTILSLRDWGRDCWCKTGVSDTCHKRFGWKLGDLPEGYDHKYIYSTLGYNLKPLDIQAAIGLKQLDKLPHFEQKRKENFKKIYDHLQQFEEHLFLPEKVDGADPSWFCFPISVRENQSFTRKDLTHFLENRKIETRMLFAGNIIRQPAYQNVSFRAQGDLKNSDFVMNNTFFVGVYPGLTDEMMEYMLESFTLFFRHFTS